MACGKDQAWVTEVEDSLKGVYLERDALQEDKKKAVVDFEKLILTHAEVQSQARADREVLQQVRQIAAEAFADLPRSALDADRHYATQDGHMPRRGRSGSNSRRRRIRH